MRMFHDAADGHPDMAVKILLPGRARGRVVMDARPLDLGSASLGRRVVEGEHQSFVAGRRRRPLHDPEHLGRQGIGAPAHRADGFVGLVEIVADAGGPEPGGGGASFLPAHQQAEENEPEAGPGAAVKQFAKLADLVAEEERKE